MIEFLVAAIVAGSCSSAVCQQQVVHAAQAPIEVRVPYVDPYWSYVVGTKNEERIRRLEEIAARQQELVEQQATIIDALRGGHAGKDAGTGPSEITKQARAILAENCLGCHQGDDPKGGIKLDGGFDVAQKLLISEVVQSGAMPPPPKQELSDEQAAIIAAWATEDSKAVRAFLRSKKEE